MSKFTKEQLIWCAQERIGAARKIAEVTPSPAERSVCEVSIALLNAAVAALTAPVEPVYQYRIRNSYNGQVTEWQTIRRDQVDFVLKAQPHNAEFQIITPPAPQLLQPAVPDECPHELVDFCERVIDSRIAANAKAEELWEACRAAMLPEQQGDDHEAD